MHKPTAEMQLSIITAIEPETATDPIDGDKQTQQRRRAAAFVLCDRAQNYCAWQMADRLAVGWELGGCCGVGVDAPADDGPRQRRSKAKGGS